MPICAMNLIIISCVLVGSESPARSSSMSPNSRGEGATTPQQQSTSLQSSTSSTGTARPPRGILLHTISLNSSGSSDVLSRSLNKGSDSAATPPFLRNTPTRAASSVAILSPQAGGPIKPPLVPRVDNPFPAVSVNDLFGNVELLDTFLLFTLKCRFGESLIESTG